MISDARQSSKRRTIKKRSHPPISKRSTPTTRVVGFQRIGETTQQRSHWTSTTVVASLIALCSCSASDVVSILRKKRQPLASLTVSAEAEQQTESPKYFNKIKLTYTVRGEGGAPLSRKAVEDAVALSKDKYCSVSAMLEKSAEIGFFIDFAGVEPLP